MTTFWTLLALLALPTGYCTVLYMRVIGKHPAVKRALARAERGQAERPDVTRLCAEMERDSDHLLLVGKFVAWGWGLLLVFCLLMEIPAVAQIVP